MTECYEKHLYGCSEKIQKRDGIKDFFDIIFLTVGWESRCTEIIEYDTENFNFDFAAIISFKNGAELGYSLEYMDKIKSFVSNKVTDDNNIFPIEYEPNDLENITRDIGNLIKRVSNIVGKPLRIGFDISSCPRYFFLYLLGFCLNNGIAQKFSFFYSEGRYSGNVEEYVHTKGNWKLIEVSNLESLEYDPSDRKMLVVSAGFEGNRFRSLVAKYEPDSVGILMPDPGFNSKYTEKVKKECKPMIEEFNIPADAIVKAPGGDAIAAWNELKSPILNRDKFHIAYLTFGPKPHVLAMGIHGYLNNKITITYRIPEGYTRKEVEPTDIFWRYDIKNLIFI